MVNRVVLVGRLTRDPELRRTNSGLQVTSFTLAFTNRTKNADGTSSSSFVTCTAWNKMAEIISQYCKKGSQLCVDGRLQENKYQRKDGTNASTVEIVVENIELLGKKSDSQSSNNSGYSSDYVQSNVAPSEEKTDDMQNVDLADDDLPF